MSWTHQSALNIDYDSEKELGEDSGFLENFNVAYDHEQAENLGNSESITMMEDVNNAYTALYEYTGQARFDTLSSYGNSVAGFDLDLRDLGAEQDLITKLRQQHPDDTRLRTYEQMIADKKPELKALRERSQDVYDRAGVMGTVGTFLGTMGAHVKDPLFMYSLPFGAGPTTAKSALGRAVQVGAKEAVIAGVAEVPVSVSRYQWKEKIESPWSVWDAAEETLMVMTGTGLLSGVGYAIGDALGWTHAAKVARENGLEGEAQILEKRAKIIEESEAQGVPVEEVLDARVEAESQMGHFDDRPITRTNLYHGSDSIFSEFKDDMIGSANDAGFYGAGHYFTDNTGEAKYYGPHVSEWMTNANIIDLIGDSTGRTHDYEGFINYARNLDEIGALDEEHQQALKAITDVNEYIDDNVDFLLKDNADGSEGFIARIDDPVQRSDTDPEYDYVDKFEPNYNMRDAPLTKDEAIKDLKEHFIRTMDKVRTGGLVHYSDYVNEHFPGLLVDRKESLADYVRTRPNGAMVLTEKAQAAGYEGIKAGDETVIFDAKNIKAVPVEGKYNADLEVPGAPILEGSEVTATVRSYAEVMEEFDAEEQLWKDVETCMMGLADGK